MTRTITKLFDSYSDAKQTVEALESAGFNSSEVGLISRYKDEHTLAEAGSATTTGATAGAVLGGGTGLLAALGIIAIPGLGPLVAAGVLATTLVGAAGGSIVGGMFGALTDHGVSEADAHVYSEAVRRGGTVVTVRTDEARAKHAESIMERAKSVNISKRREDYQSGGWSAYDPGSKGFSADEIRAEREKYLQ